MITRLTQKYKFTCDRCGKEQFCNEVELHPFSIFDNHVSVHTVSFFNDDRHQPESRGVVCADCHKDFVELAENFFCEVNKTRDKQEEMTEEETQSTRLTAKEAIKNLHISLDNIFGRGADNDRGTSKED